jgi:hypothetical protein
VALTAGTRLGSYEIITAIGAGGMSEAVNWQSILKGK